MLWVEAVAERMADHVVGYHPAMPGEGKATKSIDSTRSLEDSFHASTLSQENGCDLLVELRPADLPNSTNAEKAFHQG